MIEFVETAFDVVLVVSRKVELILTLRFGDKKFRHYVLSNLVGALVDAIALRINDVIWV